MLEVPSAHPYVATPARDALADALIQERKNALEARLRDKSALTQAWDEAYSYGANYAHSAPFVAPPAVLTCTATQSPRTGCAGDVLLSPLVLPVAAGVKYDGDKLRYDLIPALALAEVVKVLTHGAKKYGDENWRNVPDSKKRYFAATQRHQWQWKQGIIQDDAPDVKGSPGSHCSHIACAIASLMFLLEKELEGEANA